MDGEPAAIVKGARRPSWWGFGLMAGYLASGIAIVAVAAMPSGDSRSLTAFLYAVGGAIIIAAGSVLAVQALLVSGAVPTLSGTASAAGQVTLTGPVAWLTGARIDARHGDVVVLAVSYGSVVLPGYSRLFVMQPMQRVIWTVQKGSARVAVSSHSRPSAAEIDAAAERLEALGLRVVRDR